MIELPMARRTDWNALMRAVLLIALAVYVVKLLLNGELVQYIHPKFTWFTASAALGFLLMALGQLRRAFGGTFSPAPLKTSLHAMFAAVLFAGFLIRPHAFGADLAAKQGLNVTKRSTVVAESPSTPAKTAPSDGAPAAATKPPANATAPTPPPVAPAQTTSATPPPPPNAGAQVLDKSTVPPLAGGGLAMTDNTITVSPTNFMSTMMELYENHHKYAGKRIRMDGFVFHPPETAADEFALVRLVVTCHVAHAVPDGLLIKYAGQAKPEQDTWFQVQGVLEPVMYQGQATLQLKVEKLTPIEKPADPYVYG